MEKLRDILTEGFVFAGRYKLIRNLGNGGFSEVWLAEDETAKVQVAIKIYVPDGGLDEEGIEMFRHEFAVVCDMNQTNLLRPFTFDIYENHPYLVLPFCEKGSAAQLIGKATEDEIWKFLLEVASGLEFLHSPEGGSIVHQDIKPQNILITGNQFTITDFGISTKIRRTIRTSKADTEGGTLAYMGPERFSSSPDPIMASDIWSLGATIFEIMTGNVPFGEHGGLLQKNGADMPDITGGFSPELKEIVYRCLSKETWDRPTAKELREYAQLRQFGLSPEEVDKKLDNNLTHSLRNSLGEGKKQEALTDPAKDKSSKKKKDKNKKNEKEPQQKANTAGNTGIFGNAGTPEPQKKKSKKLPIILLIIVLLIGGGIITLSVKNSNDKKALEEQMEQARQDSININNNFSNSIEELTLDIDEADTLYKSKGEGAVENETAIESKYIPIYNELKKLEADCMEKLSADNSQSLNEKKNHVEEVLQQLIERFGNEAKEYPVAAKDYNDRAKAIQDCLNN